MTPNPAELIPGESDELFRGAFEHTGVAMVVTDIENRFIRANAAFARMFGFAPAEMIGMTLADVTHPDDLAESYVLRETLLAGEGRFFQREKRYLNRSGETFWGLTNVSLVRDAAGRPIRYVGQVLDITERKRLEEQFRQSQKMEAVGRLAGGIAHDFNNLLTIIIGNSELLLQTLPAGDPAHELLAEIRKAGERSAGLTSQLLAFGRKQVLAPRVLDLNDVVADAEKMLNRIIGEDVHLSTALMPGLTAVRADLGQIEQVLLNLAINARDAMLQGGRLTIETRNVDLEAGNVRGPHVLLTISDTGCGMTDEVKARLFEPFFTTKDAGKGTGLGLATVFGIVKQSGGHVEVSSAVGRGTTFKIYLPRLEPEPGAPKSTIGIRTPPRGTECVLLVEDEAGVRTLSRNVLRDCGYTVLEAARGEEALRLAAEFPEKLHLLVTDVVMPGMGGRVLAEQLAALRPQLKVLFLSGYTDDAVVRHGILHDQVHFLQKPFTPVSLAIKVREVLDETARIQA